MLLAWTSKSELFLLGESVLFSIKLLEFNSTSFSSADFDRSHFAVLLLLKRITALRDKFVAFGFSLKSLSSLAKSLSLMVLVFGTDLVYTLRLAEGKSYLPSGK